MRSLAADVEQVRYIAKCGWCRCATSTLARSVGRDYAEMGALLPLGSTRYYLAIRCRLCGRACRATRVNGRFNAEHECDARCTSATGSSCDCSCGGKNHGAAHA